MERVIAITLVVIMADVWEVIAYILLAEAGK